MKTRLAMVALLTATAISMTAVAAYADAPAPTALAPTTLAPTTPAPTTLAPTTPALTTPRPWLAQPYAPTLATAAPVTPWRALALLGLMAAVGGGALVARKRWSHAQTAGNRPRLSVLDTIRVAEKSHLVLARVGERCLLLGVTPHSVRRIAWLKLAEGAPEQAPAPPAPEEANDRDGFPGLLRQAFVQDAARLTHSEESPASAIAAMTHDHVEPFSTRGADPLPLSSSGPRVRPQAGGRAAKSAAAEAKLASLVEAQASGLTARRRR